MMKKLAVAAALLAAFTGNAYAGKTLDTIKQRGTLVCGVNPSLPGFSAADSQGNWTGLDVDVCKAFAATDRFASATRPRNRPSTTPMAASFSR